MKYNLHKTKRRAFTIVELVIVIAVIAILAAVLIPTFVSLVQTAKLSADTQLTKNMNTALAVAEATDGRNATFYDAIQDIAAAGYSVEKLTPTATGCNIMWDQNTDRMVYYNEDNDLVYADNKSAPNKSEDVVTLWRIIHNATETTSGNSCYIADDFTDATIETSAGIDVGNNTNVESVTYTNNDAAQNVIIRTNGGELTVNAPLDTVTHYGVARVITVQAIAGASWHEIGEVAKIVVEATTGNFVFEEGCLVGELEIAPKTSQDTNDKIEIKKNTGAFVTKLTIPETTKNNISTIKIADVEYKKDDTTNPIENVAAVVEPTAEEKAAFKYEIATAEELAAFRDNVNNGITYEGLTVKLTADIDLTSVLNSEYGWLSIGSYRHVNNYSFNGTFDGQNHTIKGLIITGDNYPAEYKSGDSSYASLFGNIKTATLKNFTVEGTITGSDIGGVIGAIYENCSIENITSKVTLSGKDGNITLDGNYSARGKVGGIAIITKADNVIFKDCVFSGIINAQSSGNNPAAGIVSFATNTVTIDNCKNYASITNIGSIAAGIVGYTVPVVGNKTQLIKSCINTGNITSTTRAAGIVGSLSPLDNNTTVKIYDNKNTGNITGGFEESSYAGAITSSWCNDKISFLNDKGVNDNRNTGSVSATMIIICEGDVNLNISNCASSIRIEKQSTVTINGGNYSNTISNYGNLTVNNCNFSTTAAYHIINYEGGSVTISGEHHTFKITKNSNNTTYYYLTSNNSEV